MCCQECGRLIDSSEACVCGSSVSQPAMRQQTSTNKLTEALIYINERAIALKTRVPAKQLVILVGCLLLLAAMFLPFRAAITDDLIIYTHIQIIHTHIHPSVSGFGFLIDDFIGFNINVFIGLILPTLTVFSLSLIKFSKTKTLVLGFSLIGLNNGLIMLVSTINIGAVGIGLVIYFILWVVVFTVVLIDYKGTSDMMITPAEPMIYINESARALKARPSAKRLILLGGYLLLILMLFMPLMVDRDAGISLNINNFISQILPTFVALGFSFTKFSMSKIIVLGFSLVGLNNVLINLLVTVVELRRAVDINLVIYFILWVVVFTAALIDYKNMPSSSH